jgi:L-asparaginase II
MTVLARVVRSGVVECTHHGSLVVLDADGSETLRLGVPAQRMFPRSSNKPLQAVGMLRAGLDLPADLLAVACASHAGEAVHIEAVQRILAGAGLTETDLGCPPDYPGNAAAGLAARAAGAVPRRIWMNCSGKHAAMLATCVANGWEIAGYREPEHPLQVALALAVGDLAGVPVGPVGVDGCGAPIFGLPLTALARAFARLAMAAPDSPEGRVAAAMRAYPVLVAGTDRTDRRLAESVPGLVAKAGAEGVYAAALPDGRAIALRIHDGAERARTVAMARALSMLGVTSPVVEELLAVPVLGGGLPVGRIEPAF